MQMFDIVLVQVMCDGRIRYDETRKLLVVL